MISTLERSSFLRQSLSTMGFDDDLVASEFRSMSTARASAVRLHLVAFGVAEPKDTSTAVAVGELLSDAADQRLSLVLASARDLAAPIVLTASESSIHVLASDNGETVVTLPWSEIEHLRQYRDTLGPAPLLQAKRGQRQLSLFPFPADALTQARQRQRALLGQSISTLLNDLGVGRREAIPPGLIRERQAYRAVGSALCALVLADKEGRRQSVGDMLRLARERVPSVFSWFADTNNPSHEALHYATEFLAAEADFSSIDNNVLTRIYEEVLVDPEQRRRLGIHYTPVELAERMLQNLPIEQIAPANRYVLDPACGSGTLLVAAHDRLSELQPRYWDQQQRHQDLTTHLSGQDQDQFAVELTKLALILHAIPAGNGWAIQQGDSLLTKSPASMVASSTVEANTLAPTIIVANPPFELPVNAGKRLDVAVRFLDVMLARLAFGGIMSVILPASWLSGTGATAESRDRVQRQCDIFEVWRLPRDTFRNSRASTVVLFARKRLESMPQGLRSLALVQRVPRTDALEPFYRGSLNGATRLVTAPYDRRGPVVRGLASLKSVVPLSHAAVARTGAQPLPGHLESARAGQVRDDGVLWLPQLSGLRQFVRVPGWSLSPTSWPEGFLRRIDRSHIDSPKVLLGTQATEDAPWVRAIIDERGILASKGMIWVVPSNARTVANELSSLQLSFALLAIFGSTLASTWIDEVSTGRNVRGTDLHSFPIPWSDAAWIDLADVGRLLSETAETGDLDRGLLMTLDSIVEDAYCLDGENAIIQAATVRMAGVPDPALGGAPRIQPLLVERTRPPEEPLECEGVVRQVDGDRALLWIPGVTPDQGLWTLLPGRMPGSICRPGATFKVCLDDTDDLRTGRYSAHNAEWADDDQLIDLLRSRFVDAETHG